jgi:3-oxoacyl-[acyl-carrier-protein] synthase-3
MMKDVHINSIGYYIPAGRLSNDEVMARIREANENRLGKEDLELLLYGNRRKFEFLGIRTRSCCREEDGDNTVTMALKAARAALKRTEMPGDGVDCLIVSGVSNPFREPSFALALARQLDIACGDFFDINDTCNGFMKSMDVARQYIGTGKYGNVLLVTSENPYEIARGMGIDYALRDMSEADTTFSTLLVGSGAAAVVLSAKGSGKRIVDYREKRGTADWDASVLTIPGICLSGSKLGPRSPGVRTDARLVSAQVIKGVPDFTAEALDQWGMKIADFQLIVMHQLGDNVTFATLDKLHAGREKAPVNTFRECGNMAAANIPINLAIAEEQGRVRGGDSVLLLSSACGISYSLMHVKW